MNLKKIKLGFIPANRGFFSSALAAKMRGQAIAAMESLGIEVVVPSEEQTKVGCVMSIAEAEVAARLFREANVDGIVIGAVNFGDEQSAAWAVKKAGLNVPVLIFGCQEEETLTMQTPRRDSFCGLLSIGEALRQIGVAYTVATRPIVFPTDEAFRKDIDWFARVCRVVNGLRNARYGQIGARPEAFWTCRFDEKQLQKLGATTVVLDLSEALAGARAISDDDPELAPTVASIRDYADVSKVKEESVVRSAKLELFLKRWGEANQIDAFAIQCWTSIQANYGVCSCTTMSRFGDLGKPSACEADILGAMSMHALMLAAGSPAGLADWNNLHNEDDELANIWHCGVFPASFAREKPRLGVQEIIAGSGAARYEDSQGTVEFVAKAGPITLSRVTQDSDGLWRAVVAEGAFEDNPAVTFGGYGWCRIPGLQRLYRDVLLRHFPHHVGIVQGHVGNALYEAFGNYLGFKVHHANQAVPGEYTPALPF
ncbi:MAG: L-fucose/L-arabinose isomerase family protein [Fimbriimonadales bacterium]|nr:L-fucose/L-arabinose isomerase family protein [Fimbriimonadales bacterium]